MKGQFVMLKNIEPENVFKYFFDICAIPHGSGNTKRISDYCVEFAKSNNLYVRQDEWNNVIIKKPASDGYEDHPGVMLQGHLDMVCEKNADCSIDFENDGLSVESDGDFVFAKGTTLGGDDGIAVAMILSVLSDDSIDHPEITAVFTVDEEAGMTGAANIDLTDVNCKTLINIDSEEEGILTVSCAGGAKCRIELPLTFEEFYEDEFEIRIHGLIGGHSGMEIDKGRLNSDILMGRLLAYIKSKQDFRLCDIHGGLKDNAIPRECAASIGVDADYDTVTEWCLEFLKSEDITDYENPKIDVRGISFNKCFDRNTTDRIIDFLNTVPNGVVKMSENLSGLVQTSLNLGIVGCKDNTLYSVTSVRSSVDVEKNELISKLESIAGSFEGSFEIGGEYPAWEYREESRLRECMTKVYEDMYGAKPKIAAVHAGLECGLFSSKIKDLDAVSFGPNILDIHTPKERLDIKSAERTYDYLIRVLREL